MQDTPLRANTHSHVHVVTSLWECKFVFRRGHCGEKAPRIPQGSPVNCDVLCLTPTKWGHARCRRKHESDEKRNRESKGRARRERGGLKNIGRGGGSLRRRGNEQIPRSRQSWWRTATKRLIIQTDGWERTDHASLQA